ncbi:hypothetical protein [Mucilaginibacter lacusdianchii]|uniref:hypothetical protein n=1 Tax=Mucilaginibacter lacusdianchii TaxID=2684211 RepID=UPI00131EA87F|nr:hypothetical protein [Mucilaginibacter sp. JXJ CY 39]
MNVKFIYILFSVLLLQPVYGCSSKPSASGKQLSESKAAQTQIGAQPNSTSSDEQLFRSFLKSFKQAVKQNNKAQLLLMFHYPVQTSPQWSNEDLQNSTIDYKQGLISQQELPQYFDDIFSKDAQKLIPLSKEDDLSEIDQTSTENYYKLLAQVTDKASTLYELQKQYEQDNGKETSFGFVFGKVKGVYKILSYYSPWPLKG